MCDAAGARPRSTPAHAAPRAERSPARSSASRMPQDPRQDDGPGAGHQRRVDRRRDSSLQRGERHDVSRDDAWHHGQNSSRCPRTARHGSCLANRPGEPSDHPRAEERQAGGRAGRSPSSDTTARAPIPRPGAICLGGPDFHCSIERSGARRESARRPSGGLAPGRRGYSRTLEPRSVTSRVG